MRRKSLLAQKIFLLPASVAVLGALLAAAAAVQKVEFADPGLEAAVREKLGNPRRPLARTELLRISRLDASKKHIVRLDGIEHLRQLVVLNLSDNRIEDATPLQTLRKLRELDLRKNGIRSLAAIRFDALAGLPLRSLYLGHNQITDQRGGPDGHPALAPLRRLDSLEDLELAGNRIADVTPLRALNNLRTLDLRGNRVTDISPLAGLTALTLLDLRDNDIADLAPLSGLTELAYLNIHSNAQVRSVQPLAGLTGLRTLIMRNVPAGDDIRALKGLVKLNRLNLRDCGISDIRPLGALINLRALDLRGNQVTDISPLANLTALTELDVRDNDIADLTPLSGLTELADLNIHSNAHIRSVRPLAGLTGLQTLIMRNVPVGDDIRALGRMLRLKRLNIRNCGITDTSVLGELMAEGALQDNRKRRTKAEVNILDNPLPGGDQDPYLPIRRYWKNIISRSPLALPDAPSRVAPPSFSRRGGFYDEPFELELTSHEPNAAIYYTLDGSTPTEKSTRYAGSVPIKYLVDPRRDVFTGTAVRAKVVAKNGGSSKVVTRTYFVDPAKTNRHTLPVISLVTDHAYLFDKTIGIYHPANYVKRGRSWERPVSIEFYEPDGTLGFAINGGVRIHGGTSRQYAQKSLKLYTRPEYDSPDIFKYRLFPGLTKTGSDEPLDEFKALILRNSGNDWLYTMIRDVLMQGLVEKSRAMETQASRPAIVFINGTYWGLYNLTERYDEYYIAMNYNVSPDRVAILENNALVKRGGPEDRNDYLKLRDYVKTHDMSDPAHYRHAAESMDMPSYIEYYAANIYFHNSDWPHNNIAFWRIRPEGAGSDAPPGQDGRWRWMLYGTDYGFACKSPAARKTNTHYINIFQNKYGTLKGRSANTLEWAVLPRDGRFLEEWPNVLFRKLLDNEEFRIGFINHLADQLNSSFHPERVRQRIDEMQETLEPEMEAHIRRWKVIGSMENWRKHVEVLRWFAEERPEYVRQHIIDHFKLSGCANVSLRADTQKGHVRINGLKISPETPGIQNPDSWTGIYFQDIPVKIAAIPEPGYRFAGWEGIDRSEAEITLVLKDDVTLTARFERE
jgi:Leucine-rich repeat (LRR) protein